MAATHKVGRLIQNALDLHVAKEEDRLVFAEDREGLVAKTPAVLALGRYSDLKNQKEVAGGLSWIIRQYWSSSLVSKEGIFFGARLIGSNVAQWAVLVVFISLVLLALSSVLGGSSNASKQLQPTRSVYFNDSGSFMMNESEVDEAFLKQNDLMFGYTFDDLNSTYDRRSKESLVRDLLENMVAFPGVTKFFLEDNPGIDFAEYTIESIKNMTDLNLTLAFEEPSAFRSAFTPRGFWTVIGTEVQQRAGSLE